MDHIFDSLVVGGGPAGLSTAIYLARFNRSVLVLDKNSGRSSYQQVNENYLGFPEGIHARKLRELGKVQAEKYGALFQNDEITTISQRGSIFEIASLTHTYKGRTIIFATGVIDIFPSLPNVKSYFGKTLFWCITCDGHRTINKRIVIIGHTNDAIVTCLQFLQYTDKITFLLNCAIEESSITPDMKNRLIEHNIPYNEGIIKEFTGGNGIIETILLQNGEQLPAEFVFSEQGATPNSVLAKELGITTNHEGYIVVTNEHRTNIPFVYAAGDVTKAHSHQVVTAVHEGSQAAQSANYDLYAPFQRD